jgi:cellobiose phosphorylase
MLGFMKLTRLKAILRRRSALRRKIEHEPTLRSELFSADQMERHGRVLAGLHRLSQRHNADLLLTRLVDNETLLIDACEMLTGAMRSSRRITPAAEWLLDNYYLIEEQIRTARRHLPKGYSRELPRLRNGPSAGLPRVYDIALETISHGDGRVDTESLSRFVASYQTITPLRLGELWAIPIMLRLALIENLRRVAARVMADWNDRNLAAQWADSMTEVAESDPKSVVLVVADMARSNPPMASSFVAELARRLQGQSSALALPLTWIEQRLSESGLSIEHLVQLEAQQQAADQVSIGNSIGSLRFLSSMDWREFVETMSVVEGILRVDPAGVYPAMDFVTRDHYRHVVESLAKAGRVAETDVAYAALALSKAIQESGEPADHRSHIGYFLVDEGLPALERQIGARHSLGEIVQRLMSRSPLMVFLGSLALLTVLFALSLVRLASHGNFPAWVPALLIVPTLLVASQLAIGLVNWLATLLVTPQVLPRLDYSAGIPRQARTLVVVPTMFSSAQNIEDLVEALEVRYLANRDDCLHFGLLSDWMDASSEKLEQDELLLQLARQRIEELNEKYAGENADRFFLFHRSRRWNASERVWMGFERKRGKLLELNAFLRGAGSERFSLIVGNTDALGNVKYVITLDTDTQLPRDSAQCFVGTLAHPLNRPRFDHEKRRVIAGYAILQPRVGISLPSTARSRYARLFGSDAGIDPYTRSVSDVYQDVFREGSFIGKGIYDVDAFEQAMAGRFPENRILSHDLIEGCYARSCLLGDVQLYEEYPARYNADVSRRHRWIRGDWQLLPWLLPWVPTESGGLEKNPLSALSRWKIFDNLRRSLVPMSLLALLLFGWAVVPQAISWTFAVLTVTLVPPILASLVDLLRKSPDVQFEQHVNAALRTSAGHFAQAALSLTWLPHEASYSVDAVARTLWRLAIGRRRLLQWSPSSEEERDSTNGLWAFFRLMWVGPAISAIAMIFLLISRPVALPAAVPILLLWLFSPAVSWWLSQPRAQADFELAPEQSRFLRAMARKTWAFFDAYVGSEDNWLPPDNMQEQPVAVVAHRTSPTNMGMALLANLAAYDFGFISAARLVERTGNTLRTMQRLERYRGHFYNWYDTISCLPLSPNYVSSVDSGNLAGHLLTLRAGLLALAYDRLFELRQLDGLDDSAGILDNLITDNRKASDLLGQFRVALADVRGSPPRTLMAMADRLKSLHERALAIVECIDMAGNIEAEFWANALAEQCLDARQGMGHLASLPVAGIASDRGESSGRNPGEVLSDAIEDMPTLRQLANIDVESWPVESRAAVADIRTRAEEQIAAIETLAELAGSLAMMEYDFLYDSGRDLLAIGYNVQERRLDSSFYDLLASEARLASFVGIAQGQLPQKGWFTLGRLLTTTGGEPVLLSWTGSMFEYLMPLLVMPTYEGTLLDQTCRAAVARQIEYGNQRGVPWGVSESGYNTVDVHLNYQYRAFGVPGLGLKRGLADDLVVAPYASALALMVAPEEACLNLQRLSAEGFEGRFGLYEAIDYTPARLPRGQTSAVVRSFMAHHQGMTLLSLAHLLLDRPMQKRFETDPRFRSTVLLLQERIPKTAAEYLHTSEFPALDSATRVAETKLRVFADPDMPRPAVQLLSNGRYHVMVSSGGGGYSRYKDIAVTRWREDSTCDNWGAFCYLRDVASGEFWSSAHQPTLKKPESYEAIFSDARAEFRIRNRDFDSHTEIVVSPEDDIELRRIRISNRGRTTRTIELTSYAEVVLAPAIADALHPAFGNLFVQTELVPSLQAIICSRRPRSPDEQIPSMCHLMAVHDAHVEEISYETDRARFIGRGRSVARPAAMDPAEPADSRLSNSAGSVLDPIVSIRCRITLEPEQSATVGIVTGIGHDRETCLRLIEKYRDRHLADRVFDLAWTHSQVMLRQLNASQSDAQLYERMAASIIYANASLRAESGILGKNRRGQSGLWGQSISGDLPIVLLQISDPANIELVRQLVQAHAYWRLKGLAVDLVIWNEDHAGYRQHLQDLIMGLIASGIEASLIDRPGGIFVRPAQQISSEDRILVQSVARVILSDSRGTLAEQIGRRLVDTQLPRFNPSRVRRVEPVADETTRRDIVDGDLLFANKFGGFSADGSEYIIALAAGQATPAPWANILANPEFGTVVSESGGAYTWSENAHEFRLTPWHNDPVGDVSGEAFYLRDEETGHFWSPTPLPRRGTGDYLTRHGFGYSTFEHREDGIRSELCLYVALDAPIRFSTLKVRNDSGRPRRVSVTGYVEWVLGDLRSKSAMHVVTESEPASGAMFARNSYNTEFPGRVAFFDVDDPGRVITGDRNEFLGRNGTLRAPAAMARARLSGRVGAGLDPCAAIQVAFDLADGEEREIIFRLGAGKDAKAASELVQRFRGAGIARDALDAVRAHWHKILSTVRVQTPDPAIDVLANGWLMYQTIACRYWARSGFYQSGGAYGFRDQLQDTMAMVHAAPQNSRKHLLLCAAHQFPEGDVQHWWHPPLDRGVRTRCSDDYLWLPLATSRYVLATGDRGVLDETIGFVEGRPVSVEEESYYDLPTRSGLRETLYQHCVRAIERSMGRGAHGLPLIGCGDWNDGMNRVGEHGQGESVWLGFFVYDVLIRFAATARRHGDEAFASRCENEATKLQASVQMHSWDGAWYRRAYFDDGTPLGSAGNDECQIDSIAQSWSVLSGAADDARRRQAMQSLDQRLVRRDAGLVLLLDPPFDHSALDPGYIKAYVPGVRENGGQYTHAAIWASMAFAELGDSKRAWELLRLINPVNHGTTDAGIDTYKIEPYVVAADVYGVAPHVGRGGWSWYTGSAGWMYRLILESLLGIRLEGDRLRIVPVLPREWPSFKLDYRYRETLYRIEVVQSDQATGADKVTIDGVEQSDAGIPLLDDRREHHVVVQVSRRSVPT